MGSRLPEQLAHALCFCEHGSEHVFVWQAGQVYFGTAVWQMEQRVVRRGSAIVALVRGAAGARAKEFEQGRVPCRVWERVMK